ncbi:MAG: hypothetical protein H8E98_02085, partial [Bacteroidetes bacterium]|nr:hypothetical protein [Bacteroidota bacterium]
MMKSMIITLVLLSIASQNDESAWFNKYLNDNFKKSIPVFEHAFLILPLNEGCQSCNNEILKIFKRHKFNSNITIIVSTNRDFEIPKINEEIVLIDENQKIN